MAAGNNTTRTLRSRQLIQRQFKLKYGDKTQTIFCGICLCIYVIFLAILLKPNLHASKPNLCVYDIDKVVKRLKSGLTSFSLYTLSRILSVQTRY